MKSVIKAVIFDVNGVLLLGEGKSFHQYVAKKINVDVESWFDAIEQDWSNLVEGKTTSIKFLSKMSKIFSIDREKIKKIIEKAFKRRFKRNRWLFKQLFKLKKAGYKTAILSDQVPMSYEVFRDCYMLDSKVDISVWSQKVGIRKPNPKIYKLCLDKLKIKPEEAVFIDNRKWNLTPAKKMKIKTILFEGNKKLKENKIWEGLFK